ncbi:Gfo/Idh/MocA family oxidoreductase [Ruficoccus amylovorans]|uniref:Gfo/Idh/MocA family oxidoreductase n=1 Tax=Ruficoccus amylovorans TaxID=1804625 RepID=A0A842HIE0_9BACT|nr:Gfo/Idh/MocA family oxidoreductase [Ruficoccus amylovorans]MBC2595334.1 Gfo/Idh/MocA family oxidoreductase [Ruficoccus amylovorans]
MAQKADGMNYAPEAAKVERVVEPGEFVFAAAHLDHGHIFGQCNGLTEAGAELRYVYDPNPAKVEAFVKRFPQAKPVDCLERIFEDKDVKLVAAAAVPSERGALGCRVMQAGLDYFTDKCPFTTLEQLETARKVVAETGRKYMVYYSERVHVESAWYVDQLIQDGAIGDIVHMEIFGPHRLYKDTRPEWFFQKAKYGGILTDIASHQFDQFLHYARSRGGEVLHARVDNIANPDTPELEDLGEAVLKLDTGASCFSRVNWFTPDGMRGWGDGRSFITGTKGTIEVRKYFDFGRSDEGNLVIIADQQGEQLIDVNGKVGFPFFGRLILDSLNRTESAMTQEHAFLASELSLKAQAIADQRR